MKAVLLPAILGLMGLAGGVGVGLILGGDTAEVPEEGDEGSDAEEAVAESADPDAPVEFARLNNQFIVPVVSGDDVEALVVLSVTLEVGEGGTETVFENEPRLRDRFLRVLFDHANTGGFDSGFTQRGTMTLLRKGLMESATSLLGPIVKDVLIVDIVRQEV